MGTLTFCRHPTLPRLLSLPHEDRSTISSQGFRACLTGRDPRAQNLTPETVKTDVLNLELRAVSPHRPPQPFSPAFPRGGPCDIGLSPFSFLPQQGVGVGRSSRPSAFLKAKWRIPGREVGRGGLARTGLGWIQVVPSTQCRLRSGSSAWVHSPWTSVRLALAPRRLSANVCPRLRPHLGGDQSSFPIMLPKQVGIFQESIPERRDDW